MNTVQYLYVEETIAVQVYETHCTVLRILHNVRRRHTGIRSVETTMYGITLDTVNYVKFSGYETAISDR